jgi:hypothetical protein
MKNLLYIFLEDELRVASRSLQNCVQLRRGSLTFYAKSIHRKFQIIRIIIIFTNKYFTDAAADCAAPLVQIAEFREKSHTHRSGITYSTDMVAINNHLKREANGKIPFNEAICVIFLICFILGFFLFFFHGLS